MPCRVRVLMVFDDIASALTPALDHTIDDAGDVLDALTTSIAAYS